jgi:hypothetical protein
MNEIEFPSSKSEPSGPSIRTSDRRKRRSKFQWSGTRDARKRGGRSMQPKIRED